MTTGTYTLGENVDMYSIYSGNYYSDTQSSVVAFEDGVKVHDQLAKAQYAEVAASLKHIGEAMGYEEGQTGVIVYKDGQLWHYTHSRIGKNCIVGAGAVVTKGTVVPDNSIFLGCPAKCVGVVTDEQIESNRQNALHYVHIICK